MSYLSNSATDHGLLQFGCHSYGSFTYRANTLEKIVQAQNLLPSNVNNPAMRFITEQNLALFWRRPGLYPCTNAFPLPLLDSANFGEQSGVRNRPPGNIRVDCPPIRHRRRNLLAGEHIQNMDDGIKLWAVNDFTDHKLLQQFELQLNQTHPIKKNELIHVKMREDANVLFIQLHNEALQLKAFNNGDEAAMKLFVRTKRSLDLANFSEVSISTIFNSSVCSFVQIPYMNDEIAVVDNGGLLFWGTMENNQSFTRAKTPEQLIEICPTDCPRLLLALSEKELREVDLREPSHSTGHLLYSNQRIDMMRMNGDGPLTESVYTKLSERDKFCHINDLDVHLETCLLTTNRHHILLDRRMPGITLLTMDHAEIDGADYCLTVPSFTDPKTGAQIFSLYSLTQIRKPALSHWSFAYHPQECFWSSLGPKYELFSPRTIFSFTKANSTIEINQADLPLYTRAIHYQSFGSKESQTRALLFRQMEGGEIWYENVFFDPFTKLNQEDQHVNGESHSVHVEFTEQARTTFLDESLQKIYAFQQQRWNYKNAINMDVDVAAGYQNSSQWLPKFYVGIDPELLANDDFRMCSSSAILDNANMARAISSLPDYQRMDPFAGIPSPCQQPLRTTRTSLISSNERQTIFDHSVEERQLFSHLIQTGIWPKTAALFHEKVVRRRNEEIDEFGVNNIDNHDNNEDLVGDENEDEEEQQLLLKFDEEMMYKMKSMQDNDDE